MPNFKTIQHRDNKWLLHQRDNPCVFTGSDTVEVCHIRKGSHTGLSQKPHDYLTLSLDYRLHKEQHNKGEMSFYLKMANEYPPVLMEMVLAFAKLRYLVWLCTQGREREAIEILHSASSG